LAFEPAFPLSDGGGGELARDWEAEGMEMLSEIETRSLEGVPGIWIEAMLG